MNANIKKAKDECEALIFKKYEKALAGLISMEEWESFAKTQRQACNEYTKSLEKKQEWLDLMAE